MATVTPSYAAAATVTISPASLASSATWVAGRESTEVDNTSNLYSDAQLQGFITVGTTPTANTYIRVYVWGSHTSAVSTARDVIDGADSAETMTSVGVRDGFMKLAAEMLVDATTSDRKYEFGPVSVRQALGLTELPKYWGVFIAHNTGVALNATGGNHELKFTGVKYDVA